MLVRAVLLVLMVARLAGAQPAVVFQRYRDHGDSQIHLLLDTGAVTAGR